MIVDRIAKLIRAQSHRHASSDGWNTFWSGGFLGASQQTKAGQKVGITSSEKMSAVWSATRAITNGIAVLPLNLRRHIDNRSTEVAYNHPLWPILHDQPNPVQDTFMFMDLMIPWQLNWGNAFAEKQRDTQGNVVALHPIHPSRVKSERMFTGRFMVAGKSHGTDGELNYVVDNDHDDPIVIPQRDMLHIRGVVDGTGVWGKSIPMVAAESLGIIQATETHVGSFFRNGATPDFAINVPSSVPREEMENLRASWKAMHSGSENAHSLLILKGETKVSPLTMKPEDAQLIQARTFGIEEVSRYYGVPKHFLSSMDAATYNNIEVQNLNFLTYTIQSWICRWEKALKSQLLKREERNEYSFKFNVNALMRGDSAARSAFYKSLFEMGSLSRNEIRELEDMNPIEDGDRFYIAANNLVPADRIDDYVGESVTDGATSQPEVKDDDDSTIVENESATVTDSLREASCSLLVVALQGLAAMESRNVERFAKTPREFEAKVSEFYDGKFRDKFFDVITPILEASAEFGVSTSTESFYNSYAANSKAQIEKCLFVPGSEFLNTVNQTVKSWDCERPRIEASFIFEESEQ